MKKFFTFLTVGVFALVLSAVAVGHVGGCRRADEESPDALRRASQSRGGGRNAFCKGAENRILRGGG